MKISDQSSQALVDLLSRSIRQSPARAGLRLRPERELAATLGIGRRRVALAVNKLAERGVLVRRVGSGTYIRQVPLPGTDVESPSGSGKLITPSQLFSGQASADAQRELKIARQLNIGVGWFALSDMSRANRLMLDGMMARAQELGHVITVHPFGIPDDVGFDRTTQAISRHRFDALLLCAMAFLKRRVEKAARLLKQKLPPRAYFYSSDAPSVTQPAVMINATGAARQAAEIFLQQDFKRIGLIALRDDDASQAFEAVLNGDGLHASKAFAHATKYFTNEDLSEFEFIHHGRRCAAELLNAGAMPEAIYVADDVMMLGVADLLAERGVVPGRDIAVISLGNIGGPAPRGHVWSRMLVDPAKLGRLAIDLMVEVVHRDGEQPAPGSMRLDAVWQPGETHTRPR